MIRGQFFKKTTIINVNAPNQKSTEIYKAKVTELKGETRNPLLELETTKSPINK